MMETLQDSQHAKSLGDFDHEKMGIFHETTYQVQERYYGKREDAKAHAFRTFIPKQHEDFYNKLPFTVLATIDDSANVWVTVATGEPGKRFMMATPNEVTFSGLDKMASNDDPVLKNLKSRRPMGMLGIELHTRRRNRLNGVVEVCQSGHFKIKGPLVSFGNCPQYITERNWKFRPQSERKQAKATSISKVFSKDQVKLISCATTFFMGSAHPMTGVDASHRGGPIGFVRVVNENTIMWPDFPGNRMLKSLSNVQENSKLGVWFGDFVNGNVIHMTGNGRVIWGDTDKGREEAKTLRCSALTPETARFPDTFNWVVFQATSIVERSNALSVRWDPRDDFIDLEVTRIDQETKDTKSFHLSRTRQEHEQTGNRREKLPAVIAGQYLPVFVNPSDHAYVRGENSRPLDRTYTISGFSEEHYRLTIKRVLGGKVSNFFHDEIREGSIIQAREPQGHFVLQNIVSNHKTRKAELPDNIVFISAGIGITPVLSIFSDLVQRAELKQLSVTPTVSWIYAARSPEDLPRKLHTEATGLLERYRKSGGKAYQLTQFSKGIRNDIAGRSNLERKLGDCCGFGRLTQQILASFFNSKMIKKRGAHFYVCGPKGFMVMLSKALDGFENIFTETFGPSAAE
eukprot:CAMPEP_0184493592 /NCGR_PEP_ID=MMETSP0113_2-20130426/26430_1 /TAXON_ID=91329 /ORGANISM="Norrisiella sphaerica, Strain BC52" /LENGTH=628 /DNA_ID=CAMNT_0026878911 /DNA_START=42 /DNA_END=1928 /DNA_ORIENTATION=+